MKATKLSSTCVAFHIRHMILNLLGFLIFQNNFLHVFSEGTDFDGGFEYEKKWL